MESLCLEFINSKWYITHENNEDPLTDGRWFPAFIKRWDLPDLHLSDEIIPALKELRSFLYEAMDEICMLNLMSQTYIEKINSVLRSVPNYLSLEITDNKYRLDTALPADKKDLLYYEIVLDFAKLITENPLERLKQCGNSECDWFFYDSSKSQTKKWCGNTCASLIKVRKHRDKLRKSD